MLFRAFPSAPTDESSQPGGPLYVPRIDQGGGRHDNPGVYGALYLSRDPVSAVAELLRDYAGRPFGDGDLVVEGGRRYLARIDDEGVQGLVDLDNPRVLTQRRLRPSGVATRRRTVTQRTALALFGEGVAGFEWWSTIEASWINVTLFAERCADRLRVAGDPEPLTLDHPAVRDAAGAVGVLLAG